MRRFFCFHNHQVSVFLSSEAQNEIKSNEYVSHHAFNKNKSIDGNSLLRIY